ncbi:MAG: MazG nucleotide pyrophosphohydrolase domain-containing protein [Clostridia bacterium]
MKENEQLELYEKLNDKNSLREVQKYVNEVNEIRGFNNQEITKTMLLLIEEVGELAKAIRKQATDIATDINKEYNYDTVESEVSDVFYVLSCVCNKLNIDIFNCLKDKERENINRVWK